ncbi:MAG: hypothetical protein HY046_08635 [Acidobacteria bacterium]|nr:hypothetical protein [Acidobacteriota bacterium]
MKLKLAAITNWFLALTGSLGGLGLFLVAFLDASVLTFPVANDLLVIQLSAQNPARMPYYAVMATFGSLLGCIWLYYLAKKGGELMFRKRAGARAERIRGWVQRNTFLSIAVPSLLPPPMPFKIFVLAAGVFQAPLRTMCIALVIARSLRYFGEGYLAVRYGTEAAAYLRTHSLQFTLVVLGLLLASYLVTRWLFRKA